MHSFNLIKEKTLNSLLFICESLGGAWDLYATLKILYFAEQKHLVKYGRPITGDVIIAMKFGPVPSFAYDSLKPERLNPDFFEVEGYVVSCKKKADLDYLSESDVECLSESIAENKSLSFGALKRKSHDVSYEKTWNSNGENSPISFLDIARCAGANDELIKYISLNIENDNLIL